MKQLSTFLFFLLGALTAGAQVLFSGTVRSESGEALRNVSVILQSTDTRQATFTNAEGGFGFRPAAAGRYLLTVSHTGLEPYTQEVVLRDSAFFLQVTLSARHATLKTVEVVGRVARKYTSDYSFGATRISALNKDVPQSISSITKELIRDRQAFHLADAVKIASGVIPSSFYNQYAIRGISQNEEGQIINGMRTRQYYFLQPLTTHIERVEVIKGPASATFSSVDPGGSINMVTKKPLAVDRKEVSLSVGSFSTIRGTLDVTGPLNKEKNLLYRLNGAYQEARSYRDLVSNRSFLVAPSFSYLPGDKTAVNVELILSNMQGMLDRGQPIFGAVAGATDLNSTPISLNLGASNDFFKSKELVFSGTFAHQVGKGISFNAAFMKQSWNEDLQEHRTTNAFGVDTANRPLTSFAAMQFVQRRQFWNTDNVNSYFHFDFLSGPVAHKLLVGYDLHRWQKFRGGGQNAARGFLLKDGTVAGSFVPARRSEYQTVTLGGVTMPRPNVPYFDLNNPAYPVRNPTDYVLNVQTSLPPALTTSYAVYLQEQLEWRRFRLLLSLRQEWFEDITNHQAVNPVSVKQTALLPRIGLTYKVSQSINVYGTYLEGYQPQSNTVTLMPNTGALKPGALFAPLVSDLKELGLKADLFQGSMRLTAAAYEINQKNILINANDPVYPDSLVTRGGERSRGFEMDLAGYVLPGWQVNASYSYIHAVITSDHDPKLVGARKQNTPRNSAQFWTRYNFGETTLLKGVGIGVGVQHYGNRVPWFTRDFRVPPYTLLDMGLYYQPGKGAMQLALNCNNVTDRTYWIGAQNYLRLFPGAPRNLILTATYHF